MANVHRHRFSYDKPRMYWANAARVIEIGDICWRDKTGGHNVRPANQFVYNTNDPTTRRQFAKAFAGVAESQHRAIDGAMRTRLGTAGVWEFICPSQLWEIGDMVAPDIDATPLLMNQTVDRVARKVEAIGVVARRHAAASTTVMVEIFAPLSDLSRMCCFSTTTTTSTTSTTTTTTTTTTTGA